VIVEHQAMTQAAAVARDGDTLVFTGALSRAAVAGVWTRALAQLAGVRRFDLGGTTSVDSAGLALLAALSARAGNGVQVTGDPPGLGALRDAYRLDNSLGFASA
jgi:phospholipid transport system transporter-binding protein